MKAAKGNPKVPAKETNKKKAATPDSKNFHDEILGSINIVLYSTNSDCSEFSLITNAIMPLSGYSTEDFLKKKIIYPNLIYESDTKIFRDFVNSIIAGIESSAEYRIKDRFGKEHWVRQSGVPIIVNNITSRVVGTIQDITEEKQVLLRLENSQERFRMLVNTADDLIFVLNGFGYFDMVNKNGANALGYSPDEMLGRHFMEFIDKEDEIKIAETFSKIINSNSVTTFETMFLDRFDKKIAFEINSKSIISDGEVSGMLSIGRNITIRKKDEQKIKDLNSKLIEANRIISIERERARHKISVLEELNKLKSEFISNVSHELRTPLASIVGFAETILSDPELNKETINEFSNIILVEGKRLGKLINDVLDFSKLESGEEELRKELINLVPVMDSALKEFDDQIKEKSLVLSKEYFRNEISVNADKERLAKVFSNIISNAVKFTNYGGRISVIIQEYGKEVEIIVSDTGIGIPEKDLPNLFQKFSKIQQDGTPLAGAGFGLVSVKQIIDLHKGFIKVRSQVNKGTTVIIHLPKQ